MAITFFEKEVEKAQKRFDQTFGKQIVCNLEAREAAIVSICWIGMLANKIKKAEDKETVRTDNQEFISIRNVLNNFFNLMEKKKGEFESVADEWADVSSA